jgi:sulfoxide reductase heme-binding subunit YedZ
MSQSNGLENSVSREGSILSAGRAAVGLIGVIAAASALALAFPGNSALRGAFSWAFALDSVQAMWYLTRAAGILSYLLLWLSTAWGLAVASKIFDRLLHRTFTFEFHQFISLLALGFIALHVSVLLADRYLPFTLAQILVPFASPYRPVWVGLGVISLYLLLLVTVTFYLRGRIGMPAFRAIHLVSLMGYLGSTVHAVFAGTDSSLPVALATYGGTFLLVVFLTSYWLISRWLENQQKIVHQKVIIPYSTSDHERRSTYGRRRVTGRR